MTNPTRLSFTVSGMSCGHCVRAVGDALDLVPGVVAKQVEIGRTSVQFEAGAVTPDAVIEAIREAGYEATLEPGVESGESLAKSGLPLAPTGGSCCSAR